ncbi:MAG: alpha/beta hydrolase [Flavobacteriia bacterium]|nr:MAG: alpha/beta hydrolase [Flavobacteriia bacterium]
MTELLHSKILGQGKPLLILHGLFGMGDNWITLGRQFANHFEVHLIDMRNHGRSFFDNCMHYEMMAEDIARYIAYYELENVNVIGHSMGGKATMWLSVLYPDVLDKIVVIDIAPKSYNQRHLKVFEALNKVDFSTLKNRHEVKLFLQQYIKEEKMLLFMLKNVYYKSMHRQNGSKDELAFRFNLPVLYERYSLINEPLLAQSRYEKDVLFLKGELSDYIVEDDIPLIKAHFPKAQMVEVPKASHWVHADNPEFLFKQCLTFFTQS